MSNKFTPSILIKSQIPRAIREANPLFTKFLQYYYEFVEQSKIQGITQDVLDYNDSDAADLSFLHTFFEEFKGLPNTITADPRLVAKFIYDLYKSKGTETATKLLFKIVYGEEISVRYPSDNILRASVGKWVKDTVLTFVINSGSIYPTTNTIQITSVYGSQKFNIEYLEPIPNSSDYRLFVHLNSQLLLTSDVIALYTDNILDATATLQNTANEITITNGGAGWGVGDVVIFPTTGINTIAQVKTVSTSGAIQSMDIVQYGYGDLTGSYVVSPYDDQANGLYQQPPNITTLQYNNSKATLQLTFAHQVTSPGYFQSHDGMLSDPTICLEDNFFYQIFSYVINSQHQIPEFQNTLKMIHPAGTKYFAETDKAAALSTSITVNRLLV